MRCAGPPDCARVRRANPRSVRRPFGGSRRGATGGARLRSLRGGFNGAAALLPRRHFGHTTITRMPMLQWGRGIAAAEAEAARVKIMRDCGLQWGRGIAAAEATGPPP